MRSSKCRWTAPERAPGHQSPSVALQLQAEARSCGLLHPTFWSTPSVSHCSHIRLACLRQSAAGAVPPLRGSGASRRGQAGPPTAPHAGSGHLVARGPAAALARTPDPISRLSPISGSGQFPASCQARCPPAQAAPGGGAAPGGAARRARAVGASHSARGRQRRGGRGPGAMAGRWGGAQGAGPGRGRPRARAQPGAGVVLAPTAPHSADASSVCTPTKPSYLSRQSRAVRAFSLF